MQKLITLAALAIVVLACDSSHASNRRVRETSVPATGGYNVSAAQTQGAFGRLMEMERRKNAALRQMFFGR
jgi:hypothetical protein